MNDKQGHWNRQYSKRAEHELTWYENFPNLSYQLVTQYLKLGEPFIDVGGGASKLTSVLHAAGYGPLTVLDISSVVLEQGKLRLGGHSDGVTWIEADVTQWIPQATYRVWHDRAVFHFLTSEADRQVYVRTLLKAVSSGSTVIISSFAEDGPEKCSDLPVQRYSPESLTQQLNALAPKAFEYVASSHHTHITPKKNQQNFQTSVFRRT